MVRAHFGLDHSGLLDVELVEELALVSLLPHLDRRHRPDRRVGHAQPGDGAHLVGVQTGGVPGDRRAPVVTEHDRRPDAQFVDHRGSIAAEFAETVGLDLGRVGTAAVPADVHGGDGEAARGEVLHLVAPRVPQLGPSVDAQDQRPRPGDGDAQVDVTVAHGHERRNEHRPIVGRRHALRVCVSDNAGVDDKRSHKPRWSAPLVVCANDKGHGDDTCSHKPSGA